MLCILSTINLIAEQAGHSINGTSAVVAAYRNMPHTQVSLPMGYVCMLYP